MTAGLLQHRLTAIANAFTNSVRPPGTRDRWYVLGPQSSDELEMLHATAAPAAPGNDQAPRLVFLSYRATMPEELLKPAMDAGAGHPTNLVRTIPDDMRVCEALVNELKRRIPNLHRQQIVLVGEWDTVYGRTLTRTFSVALRRSIAPSRIGDCRPAAFATDWEQHAENVHEFAYLRGLDGMTGLSASTAGEEAKDGTESRVQERPNGNRQYDYLRRLAERIRKDSEGKTVAVGILGSDTYDKLLVLNALRPLLPGTLFFTTDLDAAYLASDQLSVTQNMIVGSAFDLTLPAEQQGSIPPFRDSYQTALFATCLQLLEGDPASIPGSDHLGTIRPKIFEISRDGPVELGVRQNHRVPVAILGMLLVLGVGTASWIAHLRGVLVFAHPPKAFCTFVIKQAHCCGKSIIGILWCFGMAGWFATIWQSQPESGIARIVWNAILLIFVVGAFYLIDSIDVSTADSSSLHRTWGAVTRSFILVLTAVGGTFILFFNILFAINSPDEEPLFWTAGISIWPSTFIRLLATALAVVFAVAIERNIAGFATGDGKTDSASAPAAASNVPSIALWPRAYAEGAGFESIWSDYLKSLDPKSRLCRIGLYAVAFCMVCTIILVGTRESNPPPVRGEVSATTTIAVLLVSGLAFLYLLLFVIDTVLLTAAYIARIAAYVGSIKEIGVLAGGKAVQLMRRIERIAEPASSFVYYPFGVLFAMIAARNPLFDSWAWPLGLVAIFTLQLLLLVAAAFLLQFRAKTARKRIIETLRQMTNERGDDLAKQCEQIESLSVPLFASWRHNPILYALLIPLGGVGSIKLLEQFAAFIPGD